MLRQPQPRVDWTALPACSWKWRPAKDVQQLEAKWRPTVFEPQTDISTNLRVGTCQTPAKHGRTWHMMRFGPFSTRGGYDWTNLTIGDLIALNGIKETTETERVALHVNVARLETEDGAPIPLPPLHLHHFEVYTRWRGRVFLSITNDHLCADKPATGFECLGTDFGDYVMLFPLGGTTANSIVNDCLLYTSPSPRDGLLSRMPSSA